MKLKFYPIFKCLCFSFVTALFIFLPLASQGQEFTDITSVQCITTNGGTTSMSLSNVPPPAGNGVLTFYYQGDLDGTGTNLEQFTLSDENSNLLGVSAPTVQCSGAFDSVVFSVPSGTLAQWAADGNISFTAVATSAVGSTVCSNPGTCTQVKISYPSVSGPDNAAVAAIDSPSNYCPGAYNIVATIANAGTNQIKSLTINWRFDGILQSPVTYTQLLDTLGGAGNHQAQVVLGNKYFAPGVAYDIKVWTSNPNGLQDTMNLNDTVSKTITNLASCSLPRDVGVTNIISPNNDGCQADDSTEFCVMIKNYGYLPQDSIIVSYQLFNVVVATETVPGTLNPGDSIMYCFSKVADLSLPGLYPFNSWTSLAGDGKGSNDSLPYFHTVQSDTVLSNFPHIVTFEENPGSIPNYWSDDPEDDGEDWRFTTASMPLNVPNDHTLGTSSGHVGWVDNSFPDSDPVNLLSPCLNLQGLANPHIEFYYLNEISSNLLLYVDVFYGGSWNNIAGPLTYTGNSNWNYYLYSLKPFAGDIVKVRFRMQDQSGTLDDAAIDDIKIFDLPPINLAVNELLSPESACDLSDIEKVEVRMQQIGYDMLLPGDSVHINYTLNGGPVVTEYMVLGPNDSIKQLENFTYSFSTFADLSVPGSYTFKVWTDHPLDIDQSNDTLIVTRVNTLVKTFPHGEDFESFNPADNATGFSNGWYPDPANTSTEYTWHVNSGGTPSSGGPTSGHSGSGNYVYTEASDGTAGDTAWLYNSNCYDLSQIKNPGLNFWYVMNGATFGNYFLDINVDGKWINGIWHLSYNAGPDWNLAIIDLIPWGTKTVKFRFRAVSAGCCAGDFAIDDWRIGESPKEPLADTIKDCGSANLNALNPGSNYLWSTGQTSQKIAVVYNPNLPNGDSVSVEIINNQGMIMRDSAIVILQPGPHVDLGSDTLVCGGSDLTLDAGNPGMLYVWDDGSQGAIRKVNSDGTYFVAVDNGSGCIKSDTVTVEFEDIAIPDFIINQAAPQDHKIQFDNNSQHSSSYQWDFGDGFYSTAFDPSHYYINAGTYKVSLIVMNKCGTDTLTKTVTIQGGVGIEQLEGLHSVSISPNPSNGSFNIALKTSDVRELLIEILDVKGEVIIKKAFMNISGKYNQEFDLSSYGRGVYLVRFQIEGGTLTHKVLIQ